MPVKSSSSAPKTSSKPKPRPTSAPESSARPQARPTSAPETSARPQARPTSAPETSARPQARPSDAVEISSDSSKPEENASSDLVSGLLDTYGEVNEAGSADSTEATNDKPYEGIADHSASVTVEPWSSDREPAEGQVSRNDNLEGILRNQGYESEDIYAADENGKTLLDRVVEANNLRDGNLIHPEQELIVPTLHAPEQTEVQAPTNGPDDGSRTGQEQLDIPAPTNGPDDGSRTGQEQLDIPAPTSGPDDGSRAGREQLDIPAPTSGPDDGSRAGQEQLDIPAPIVEPMPLFEDGVEFRTLPEGQARNYPTIGSGGLRGEDGGEGIINLRDERVQDIQALIEGGQPLTSERAAEILGEGWSPIQGLPEGTAGYEFATSAPGKAQRVVFNTEGVGILTEQPNRGNIYESALMLSPDGSVGVSRPSRVGDDNPGNALLMSGEFVRAQ